MQQNHQISEIRVGDWVCPTGPVQHRRTLLLLEGRVGQVVECLETTAEGPKFAVVFEHYAHRYSLTADELKLVQKGKLGDENPFPMPPNHPQKQLKLGVDTVEVDVEIAPLIKVLYRAGMRTCGSCQDQLVPDGTRPGIIWLEFCTAKDALKFIRGASKVVDWFAWDNDADSSGGSGDDFASVSIRFPARSLEGVIEIFQEEKVGS